MCANQQRLKEVLVAPHRGAKPGLTEQPLEGLWRGHSCRDAKLAAELHERNAHDQIPQQLVQELAARVLDLFRSAAGARPARSNGGGRDRERRNPINEQLQKRR
jgi:hypothetical protein